MGGGTIKNYNNFYKFFSIQKKKKLKKKIARQNDKRTKSKFNLELYIKGQQTWEYSRENK